MTLPTVSCPTCGRLFKNEHGRGGHLTTVNDPAHESYRAAHGMPAKTPRATQAATRGRPPAASARSPSPGDPPPLAPPPSQPPARPRLTLRAEPSNPAPPSTLPASAPTTPTVAAQRPGASGEGFMRSAVDDFLRKVEASRQAQPANAKPRKPKTKPEESSDPPKDAAGVLAGAGIVAGIIGLVGVVKSLKGANAPKAPESQAPPKPWAIERSPPPQDLPDWINALNGSQPMTGGIRSRQPREWWYL